MKPKMLLIDSRDRVTGTTDAFTINLVEGLKQVKGIRLEQFVGANTFYTIRSNYNTQIPFYDSGAATATLTPGIYTATSLVAAVATAMTAASPASATYTGSYSTVTLLATFTISTGTFYFRFAPSVSTQIPLRELGFTATNGTAASSQTGISVVQCDLPLNIGIQISALPTIIARTDSSGNAVTFTVPITVNSGGIYYTDLDGSQINKWDNPLDIQTFSVSIVGRSNEMLSLNGSDWTCLIEIYY